jgi:pimeloyl-ACP methyl ester carboxylesterase
MAGGLSTFRASRAVSIGVVSAALLVPTAAIPAALAAGASHPVATQGAATTRGWEGITRKAVSIDLGKGWTSKGELTYPSGATKPLPVLVLLHGSGHNDMNETLSEDGKSEFVPIAQAAARAGYAVMRFNKRGVLDVGPVLTKDTSQLDPPKPFEQIMKDAATVVRFTAKSPVVDPKRIFLLGHSEGTVVASNLAASPAKYRIAEPAGVITMGLVGLPIRTEVGYQVYGRQMDQYHEEFDNDRNGVLTLAEARNGLVGQQADVATELRTTLFGTERPERRLNPALDRNHDGKLSIDTEIGPALRTASKVNQFPDLPALTPEQVRWAKDIMKYPNVTQALPRFNGPTLLLNGDNDSQTLVRGAYLADAAIAAAGRKDHTLKVYPGVGHTMNQTARFVGGYGEPDPKVLNDIQDWLAAHR